MRKPIAIFILFVIIPLFSAAQVKKEIAMEHIQTLQEGALLVRLKTSKNKINALKEAGKEKEAERMVRFQELENKAIASAFITAYNFSPVYFFYSSSSENLAKGNLKGHILNSELVPDTSILPSGKSFLIAEFDVSPSTGVKSLVVRDKDFNYLKKPFPNYIRTFEDFFIFSRSRLKVIEMYNNKLNSLKGLDKNHEKKTSQTQSQL
jgi:hypothetical protein